MKMSISSRILSGLISPLSAQAFKYECASDSDPNPDAQQNCSDAGEAIVTLVHDCALAQPVLGEAACSSPVPVLPR